jgi:hypothetical protein
MAIAPLRAASLNCSFFGHQFTILAEFTQEIPLAVGLVPPHVVIELHKCGSRLKLESRSSMNTATVSSTATDMVIQNAEFNIAELSIVYLIKHERSNLAREEESILCQNEDGNVSASDVAHLISARKQLRHDIRSLDLLLHCHAKMNPVNEELEPMHEVLEVVDQVTDEQIICATSRQIGTLENVLRNSTNVGLTAQINQAKRTAMNFIGTVQENLYREPVLLYA